MGFVVSHLATQTNTSQGWGTQHLWRIRRKAKRPAQGRPFLLVSESAARYVVERGLTAMAVAGTMAVPGFGPE